MRVQVTVQSAQTLDGQTEKQQFTTAGMLTRSGKETLLRYTEQGEGMEGVITTVTVCGRCVRIGRGRHEALCIEAGVCHVCAYPTPYGTFSLGVTGYRLHADVQGDTGSIAMRYALDTDGVPAGEIACRITYKPL